MLRRSNISAMSNLPVQLGRVSVVVPFKGRSDLLAETVASLRAQTHLDWEGLLVDDGSDEVVAEQVASWTKTDARLKLLHATEGAPGANRCRNLGIAASTGEFVVFLDSDDCLSPECLRLRVQRLQAHRDLDFIVHPHRHFRTTPGDMERVIPAKPDQDDITRFLRVDIPWQTTGPTWRRTSLVRLGPWDERLPSWQDWDFHVRALAQGLRYRCFEAPHFFHRVTSLDRESISARKPSAAHRRGHVLAITSAFEALSRSRLLTRSRRQLLARLILNVAEQWHVAGDGAEALKLWSECRSKGLLDTARYWEGMALLRSWRVAPARALLRRYVATAWPLRARLRLWTSARTRGP